MRRHIYETVVTTSPEKLFRAISDISNWPRWGGDLESTEHDGSLSPGTRFSLKPRGGPRVAMSIEAAEAPHRFVDLAHFPLGRMRTTHEFLEEKAGTRVRITIEVFGPLAFLWDHVVAKKQASSAAVETVGLARYADGLQ